MTTQSPEINELMTALCKAQGAMRHAVKDSNNPFHKSKYADLASVWEACRDVLSSNGLAVVQTMGTENGIHYLITTLGHSSGQWIKSSLIMPLEKMTPQLLGASITYCRRYALAAIVGVYQDDDDGEKAEAHYKKKDAAKPEVPKEKYASQDQIKELYELLDHDEEASNILAKKYQDAREMTEDSCKKAIAWLKERKVKRSAEVHSE